MAQTQVDDSAFQAWLAVSRARAAAYWQHRKTETVPLSMRAFKGASFALSRKGLGAVTPENVAHLRAKELKAEDGFGPASLIQVKAWLASYGLTLRGTI